MKVRILWVVGVLVIVTAGLAMANVPPTMKDQYVSTVQNTSVMFELRAQDEDIDPADPGAHPIRFVLLDGPSHGILLGDMAEVRYEGPHDAVAEMTYVPASGFVGIDLVMIAVYDSFDDPASGTVTIQIDVAARRAEGLLSGNWSMNVTWESQSGSFSAFATQMTEVYRIGALTLKGVAQIRKALVSGVSKIALDALRFNGDIKLETLSVTSTLAFDPDASAPDDLFDYWRTVIGFPLQGADFRYAMYLASTLTSSYQSIYMQAQEGDMRFSSTVRLDMTDECAFEFGQANTSVGWRWCDLRGMATLSLTGDGFQQLALSLSDFPVSTHLPGLTLDTGLTFTLDTKTLSMTLDWHPLNVGCIRLYSDLDVSGPRGLNLDGFSLYGLRIECTVGDVRVVSATSLDPARNSSVTGKTDYFEVLRMSGTLMECCRSPGTWRISTYFNEGATTLFDWGMTTIRADVALSDRINVSFETVFRSGFFGDPKSELSVGWMTRW